MDEDHFYLRLDVDGAMKDIGVGFYFNVPGGTGGTSAFSRDSGVILGIFANKLVEWNGGRLL